MTNTTSARTIRKYRIHLFMVTILASGLLNSLLLRYDNVFLLLFLPPITWALALLIPVYRKLDDKTFAFLFFISSTWILWFFMLMITGTFGSFLFHLHPAFGFPVLGGIAAAISCLLYGKFVLEQVSAVELFLCFGLGYCALLVNALMGPSGKIVLEHKTILFFLWQSMVGLGHVIAFVRNQFEKQVK